MSPSVFVVLDPVSHNFLAVIFLYSPAIPQHLSFLFTYPLYVVSASGLLCGTAVVFYPPNVPFKSDIFFILVLPPFQSRLRFLNPHLSLYVLGILDILFILYFLSLLAIRSTALLVFLSA